MPTFAPVYAPSHRTRADKNHVRGSRKRKREAVDADADDSAPGSDPVEDHNPVSVSFRHPVNRTDPYYVAGAYREDPLPAPPFPHSALKEPKALPRIDKKLRRLRPPLQPREQRDLDTSLKRQHVENLATLLHTCMLRGDWQRAARAWALLLRTEVAGHGLDMRQHGRWMIGAELLMRRGDKSSVQDHEHGADSTVSNYADAQSQRPTFTNHGLQLARDYYERLILQYPHTPRTQRGVNSLVIYPGLFSVWVHQVQDRAKRAKHAVAYQDVDSSSDMALDFDTNAVLRQGLGDATLIANRLDELMATPPYDANVDLLRLRGMVGLWIADSYSDLKRLTMGTHSEDPGNANVISTTEERGGQDRQRAHELLVRARAAGADVPDSVLRILEN